MLVVSAILAEAYDHQHIPHNPAARMGAVKYKKTERSALTVEQIRDILDKCHPVVAILAYTGMRASEALAMTWGQLNGSILTIDRAWKTVTEIGPPKWGKSRVIPLPVGAVNILADIKIDGVRIASDDLVFCYDDGSRVGYTWLKKRIEKALPKGITAHHLRHSLNTNLLVAGADPLKVQAYLGWSPRVQVLTPVQAGYTHLSVHHLQDVADMIGDLYG